MKPNAYASKTAPAAPSFGKAFSVQKADHLPYSEGERVKHVKFGEGTVKKIEDGGKDFEVTVEFDRVGVKKIVCIICQLIEGLEKDAHCEGRIDGAYVKFFLI